MHLSNILLQKKVRIVIFLLSILIVLMTTYPLLRLGSSAVFFSVDPDVVYVANALSYIKWKIIGYYDHPGTPSIYFLSQALLPLRIYAKYFLDIKFLDFIYQNFEFIFTYLRFFQAGLFLIGLNVYFSAIYKFNKSLLSVIFSALLLLTFGPIYYLGLSISAESLNLLLVSVWIYVFVLFNQNKKKTFLYLLLFLSGLLFANRATNIFYLFAGIMIAYFSQTDLLKKFLSIVAGLVIGLWPVKENLSYIIKRIFFFANASGVHGSGSGQIIDFNLYLTSLITFWNRDTIFSITIITLAIIIVLIWKRIDIQLKVLSLFAFIFILLFAKFPLAHYQIPNYLFIVFVGAYIFKSVNKLTKIALIILLLIYSFGYSKSYLDSSTLEMNKVKSLEIFVENNKPVKGEVWEWARSKHFAYLWTNSWGSAVLGEQLAYKRIYLLEKDIFNRCWDKLYIQKISYPGFEIMYKDRNFSVQKIEGNNDILLIESSHCLIQP